jgi:hypothetical protein
MGDTDEATLTTEPTQETTDQLPTEANPTLASHTFSQSVQGFLDKGCLDTCIQLQHDV